jgi:hypothetical protein
LHSRSAGKLLYLLLPDKLRISQLINESHSVLAISISGQAVTACHIVRQLLSKFSVAKVTEEITFHQGIGALRHFTPSMMKGWSR